MFVLALSTLTLFAPASAEPVLHLNADQIAFYYNRFVVQADGDVHVDLGNGVSMTGQTFSMDLKLNRFLLAGNVTVNGPTGTLHGAAASDFLSFNRLYFIPVTSAPDRWTYADNDFSHPFKGRDMPGDAFFFADSGSSRAFLYARRATIGPNSYASFQPARVNFGLGYVPTPSFVVTFSTNPNIAQNSLSGATFDATYPFMGSNNANTALHFRYDPVNRTYLSIEQHLATPKSYAVFSVNPLTRPSKFWNLVMSDRFSQRSQIQTFTQLHTFQSGLSMPVESSQYTNVTYTQAFRTFYAQASTNFYNQSLLAPNANFYFGDPSHTFNAAHPVNAQVLFTQSDQQIGHLPLYERLRYGFFYAHDRYGIRNYAAPGAQNQGPSVGYAAYGVGTTLWQNIAGVTLYTPSFKLARDTFINGFMDKQRQFGPPHYVDTTNTTLSLSRTYGPRAAGYLAYSINNIQDVYGGSQRLAYPSYVPIVNGVPYPGFAAFQGLATLRTLTAGMSYTPSADLAFNLTLQKHNDFPAPIPFYYGAPPYNATADVRFRISPHMMVDLSRSYYFNFANQTWSPQFTVQFLP